MTLDVLYPLITEAIRRAETLEDLQAPGARSAYLDVSLLEEKIAEVLPSSDPEGAIARRGAVRAAVAAQDMARAQQLAERFIAEAGDDTELRSELLQLLEQGEHVARNTEVILLVQGESPSGGRTYAYVAVPAAKLDAFMEAQKLRMFYPEQFGIVLESGDGEPPPAVRRKMETEYGFIHVETRSVSV